MKKKLIIRLVFFAFLFAGFGFLKAAGTAKGGIRAGIQLAKLIINSAEGGDGSNPACIVLFDEKGNIIPTVWHGGDENKWWPQGVFDGYDIQYQGGSNNMYVALMGGSIQWYGGGYYQACGVLGGMPGCMQAQYALNGNIGVWSDAAGHSIQNQSCLPISLCRGKLKVGKCHYYRNGIDPTQNNSLLSAISKNDLANVEEVVALGADVNALDKDGETALMIALKQGMSSNDFSILDFLIGTGNIDFTLKNKKGLNVIQLSFIAEGNKEGEVTQYLESLSGLIFVHAINGSHPELNSALLDAAVKKDLPGLQKAIQGGADANARDKDGNTVLMLASQNANADIVYYLISTGNCDYFLKNKAGLTALEVAFATEKSLRGPCTWLIRTHSGQRIIDPTQNSALLKALKAGDTAGVVAALQANADPNVRDENNNTALILAVQTKNLDLVTNFVRYGLPDINAHDQNGETALMAAIRAQSLDIVNFLLPRVELDLENKNLQGQKASDIATLVEGNTSGPLGSAIWNVSTQRGYGAAAL